LLVSIWILILTYLLSLAGLKELPFVLSIHESDLVQAGVSHPSGGGRPLWVYGINTFPT